MTRSESLEALLQYIARTSPDIEAAAVVDNDGLMVASVLATDLDGDSVAAVTAAILSIAERTVQELHRGDLELMLLKGSLGYSILARAGSEYVLTVLAKSGARLGMLFIEVKRAAAELALVVP